MNSKNISYNFSIAKILSILMVAVGHYFGGILWIPTTFALFIFGFSSGFFTGGKYHNKFNLKEFWYLKVIRLTPSLIIINIFLLILFIFQGKEGIESWQTIISMLGLSGFFTWFHFPNPSPYGNGLWFFTLLLIYYLIYPLIRLINQKKSTATIFLVISLLVSFLFNYIIPMGHALWLTAYSFLLGNYLSIYGKNINPLFSLIIFLLSCSALLITNIIFNFNILNYFFIFTASVATVIYLLNGKLPVLFLNKILILSGCVIHIYFIHTYLFFKNLTNYQAINFIISITTIVCLAFLLYKIQYFILMKITKLFKEQ